MCYKPPHINDMGKRTPKYLELVNWIKKEIKEEHLLPGQKMYSENELSEMFSLSRQTVRHAVSVLENENIINRIQGSGTYINDGHLPKRKNRNRIAVITTYVDNYIFPRMIQSIEQILFERGYSAQIAFTNNLIAREKTILEDILARDEVAGVICETTKSGLPNPNLPLYQKLLERKTPVLFINSYYPSLSAPHVSMNDKMAGRVAVEYLIRMGHTRIGGIFKLDDGQGHQRYAGYVEAMNQAGIAYDDANVVWVDTEEVRHLEKFSGRILARIRGCSAVVAYNDEVAFGLMEAMRREGIRIPANMSIVGIDDSDLAVLGDVNLTSIPHPMEKLGEKAAYNLLKMIRDPAFDGNYEFDVEVRERDSVKNLLAEKVALERIVIKKKEENVYYESSKEL